MPSCRPPPSSRTKAIMKTKNIRLVERLRPRIAFAFKLRGQVLTFLSQVFDLTFLTFNSHGRVIHNQPLIPFRVTSFHQKSPASRFAKRTSLMGKLICGRPGRSIPHIPLNSTYAVPRNETFLPCIQIPPERGSKILIES